jgi:regulatory protein
MVKRPPASLKVRALQWLAQREHSRSELRERLLRLATRTREPGGAGDAPDRESKAIVDGAADPRAAESEIDTLLDWLAEHRYLSDARFVESRLNARRARFGHFRIEREIGRHDLALGAEQLRELRATEYERALAVWRRKFGSAPATEASARLRQMRFLAGRGFSPDVIRRVLRQSGLVDDLAEGPDSAG